jgi:sterol desaturase/sphingolipid hydroxylase (fatty acid hydroxylase superfamily)
LSPISRLPDVDLETGREVVAPKQHWWTRKKKEGREHHELTQQAHEKSKKKLFKDILYSSWMNLLLVFIPVGIALHFVNVSPTVVFVMNFLAIVPLAGVCLPFPTARGIFISISISKRCFCCGEVFVLG